MLLGLFNCNWAVVMCRWNGICGVKMTLLVVLLFRSKEREILHICFLLCKKFMLLAAEIGSESVRKCVCGGCGISGLGPEWARENGLQDIKVGVGEGSFRSRWTYEFWDDNVCKWGCKYLHPGLQIFASDAPVLVDCVLSIWESIRKHSFCRAGMLAIDIFSAWDSVFRRLDALFWCFSASVGCSCSLPWFVLTHSEEMFEWQIVGKRLLKPTKC